jgi:hypothetical protein
MRNPITEAAKLFNPDPIDALEKRARKAVELSHDRNNVSPNYDANFIERFRKRLNPIEMVHYDACELHRQINEHRQDANYIRSRPPADWFGEALNQIDSKGVFSYLFQRISPKKETNITQLPELAKARQLSSYEQLLIFDKRLKKLEKSLSVYYPEDKFLPKELAVFVAGSSSIAFLFYLLGNFDEISVELITKATEMSNIEGLEVFAHFLHGIEKSDLWHEYLKYIYNVYGLGYVLRKLNVSDYLPEGSKIQQIIEFVSNNTKMDFNSEGDGEKQVQNAFFIWLINKFLHSPFVH